MSRKLTTEKFIERAREIHGNKYDYTKVKYLSLYDDVIIIFNNTEYLQKPYNHLRGRCPDNTKTKRLTTEEFIKISKEIHGENKYDYSLVEYVNNSSKVKIIHNGIIYEQLASNHLKGFKCENVKKLTQEEFIRKSKEIHGDKYDYSLINFKNIRGKIKLIYNEKIYEQFAYAHLQGKSPRGTEYNISKGEILIEKYLIDNNIEYVRQHWYSDCKNILPLPFDFYLPKLNILIEYDGRQHFEVVEIFGGKKEFIKRVNNDKIKNEYCIKNRIPLIRISYLEDIYTKLNGFLTICYI